MTPDQYCQQKAAKSGSSFYYSFLFLPPPRRRAITALYAFCREVDDIVDECSQIPVAQAKLQWWREEIDRLFAGNPQHPITLALLEPVRTFHLSQSHFRDIMAGVAMDLEQTGFQTFEDLKLYCYRVAGAVGLLAIEIFGYRDPATREYAEKLGLALQLTNILRDVREDLDRDRVYIPKQDFSRFDVTVADLATRTTSDALRALFHYEAQRAYSYFKQAFEALPDEDRYAQRCGIIMAEIYKETLQEIEKDGFRVLEQRVRLTPFRKLWLAWKTARREKKYLAKTATAA